MERKFKVMVKTNSRDRKELERAFASAAGLMKQIMGVANNAAWLVALDARDCLSALPSWNRTAKGGRTVAQGFKRVFDAFHAYERKLIYGGIRFFDLADMPERTRKMYGNVSNREYYDFWAAIGASSYQRTRPLVTSLWNKYRLALIRGGIDDSTAETAAWGMCAEACLNSAVVIYHQCIRMVHENFHLPLSVLEPNFQPFCLKDIVKLWDDAMQAALPSIFKVEISNTDAANINDGIRQVMEAWTNGDDIYDDMEQTLEECGEDVMKTKGYIKKAIDDVEQLRRWHDEEQ